ncbi:MAG: hypothetical protein K0U78_13620 [Actinomycetia bacterium]|nr:hypothetical protein [Actinomycetes bacterium]
MTPLRIAAKTALALLAALIVLAICYQPAGAGDLYAYVEGAIGHRAGMEESWEVHGERVHGTQELNLGRTVGHVAAGLGWRALYLEAQHVSSLETPHDGGFNALFLGVRHEWRF